MHIFGGSGGVVSVSDDGSSGWVGVVAVGVGLVAVAVGVVKVAITATITVNLGNL